MNQPALQPSQQESSSRWTLGREQRPDEPPIVTLAVGASGVWMLAGEGEPIRLGVDPGAAAGEMFAHALAALRHTGVGPEDRPVWRLVLDGGFYHLSHKPIGGGGRWTREMAKAAAAELEPNCPRSLDGLIAAALPVGEAATWVVALPKSQITTLRDAAAEVDGVDLEGVWTAPAAVVERFLEAGAHGGDADGGLALGDGRIELVVQGDGTSGLSAVRVCMCYPEMSAPPDMRGTEVHRGGNGRASESSPPHPLLCAHSLTRTDPSESLNLLNEGPGAGRWTRRRQLPLARGCWWAAAGLALVALALLVFAEGNVRRARSASDELRSVWNTAQGGGAVQPPPLVVDALTRQAAAWRNLHERGLLGRPGKESQLVLLAACVAALPEDLVLSVDHVRQGRGEAWLSGKVRTQADARALFEALATIPGATCDSQRTAPAQGGFVSFSVRLGLTGPLDPQQLGGTSRVATTVPPRGREGLHQRE